MTPFHFRNFTFFTIIIAFVAHQVYTYSIEDQLLGDQNNGRRRQLTPEEEELANQARAEIAKAIENNLVRIFAVIAAQGESEEQLYPRQEEDDDDLVIVTPNPNVLPQVAQILGAIFSGNLNITRIVDNTVGLVPNLVRNQLQGLVKLLTGENVNLSGSTTPSPSSPGASIPEQEPAVIFEGEDETTKAAAATKATPTVPTSTRRGPYTVKNRTKRPTIPTTPAPLLIDDEIERLERELRAAAKLTEPFVQNKEPRVYAGIFQNVLKNVNMTEVAKAVPSIFKGANQAFTMLENLGVLEALPGGDILEDLDLGIELDE